MNSLIKQSVFVFFFFTESIIAQTVGAGWVVEDIHGPSQVGIVDSIPVDLNKDGQMDVVSVSFDDGHLRAYINQGNLEFEQFFLSKDLLGAFRISATDLNNDGETDFLIPSIDTQQIIALMAVTGQKPFTFQKRIIADAVLLPTDALAADFNLDGLLDVVSTSFEENLLLLHTQDINGQFFTAVVSESPIRPRKLVVEDFDNDGLPDILVASSDDNSIRLLVNKGNGSFTENLISDQMNGVIFIALCDQEGAMFPDFVAGVNGADQVVLFNNINGITFSSIILDGNLPGASAVHCSNIDGDPDLELISISNTLASIYTQEITGVMNKQVIANNRDGYVTVNVANFELNNEPQILTQSFFAQRNFLYLPGQVNQETVVWEDFPDGARTVASADLNGNGTEDIVVSSFRSNELILYADNGVDQRLLAENLDGVDDITLFDLDDNNFIDILVTTAFGDEIFWFKNTDGSQYEQHLISGALDNPQSVKVADINGDQQADVIATSSLDDAVWWFERDDDTFIGHIISTESDGAKDVCAKDLTGSGMVDLVVGNFFGGSVDLWVNVNNGSNFDKINLVSGILRPDKIECTDFNEDGYIDILVSASGDGQMLYLEGQNGLSFKVNVLVDNLSQPRGFSLFEVGNKRNLVIADNGSSEVIEVRDLLSNSQRTGVLAWPLFGINSTFNANPKNAEDVRLYTASTIESALRRLTFLDLIFTDGFNP